MKIFRNPADGRLRAGWRIAIFQLALMGLAGTGLAALRAAGLMASAGFLRDFLAIGVSALAATAVVPSARRVLDRRSVVSLGLRVDGRAVADLTFGFALSGAMAGTIFAAMAVAGWIEVGPLPDPAEIPWAWLAAFLALHAVVAWWEELVFRGYLLQNLVDGLGLVPAVVVSCLLYGLVHAANPNAGIVSTSIIVLFGLLRIYGWLTTRQLWLSMGMHFGWNFFQGPVFGWAASGYRTATLVDQTPVGPDWLSGGAFGPEASIVTVPVLALALLAMYAWAARRARAAR